MIIINQYIISLRQELPTECINNDNIVKRNYYEFINLYTSIEIMSINTDFFELILFG